MWRVELSSSPRGACSLTEIAMLKWVCEEGVQYCILHSYRPPKWCCVGHCFSISSAAGKWLQRPTCALQACIQC